MCLSTLFRGAAPQKNSQSNSSQYANSIRSGSHIFFNPAAKQTNPRSISQLTWLDGASGKSFLKQATRQLAATPELTKFDNTYKTIVNGVEDASSMLDSGNMNGMLNSMNDLAKFAQTIS